MKYRRLSKTQLERVNDLIYVHYVTQRIENKTADRLKVQVFFRASDRIYLTAFMFFFMSKLLNKHPQSLYPNKINALT